MLHRLLPPSPIEICLLSDRVDEFQIQRTTYLVSNNSVGYRLRILAY